MTLRSTALALVLFGCGDDERPGSTSSAPPDFTVCQECPIGGPPVCAAGQVCASITPGSGGICILACSDSEAEPCVYEGRQVGTCKAFSPDDVTACNDPDNGPVCPPE